ncbi:single-stranded DNA-binding protein [Pseudonocardia alni]|uniref:single-stranded DNA-binding protein n=1 Tax=Pseudonocardia alni TaxID=33907 RepID=UPI0033C49122
MNDQTYIGNIGKKPTFEFNEHTGRARLQFSLAINKRYQDRDTGEWRDGRTLWLNVVAFGPVAENASNLGSGDPVVVIGQLADNSFTVTDDDGQSREIPHRGAGQDRHRRHPQGGDHRHAPAPARAHRVDHRPRAGRLTPGRLPGGAPHRQRRRPARSPLPALSRGRSCPSPHAR